jgi:hypothetical protein
MTLDGTCEGSVEGKDVMGIGATGALVGRPRLTGASVSTPLLLPREGISLGNLDGKSGSVEGVTEGIGTLVGIPLSTGAIGDTDIVEGVDGVVVVPEGSREALMDGDNDAMFTG